MKSWVSLLASHILITHSASAVSPTSQYYISHLHMLDNTLKRVKPGKMKKYVSRYPRKNIEKYFPSGENVGILVPLVERPGKFLSFLVQMSKKKLGLRPLDCVCVFQVTINENTNKPTSVKLAVADLRNTPSELKSFLTTQIVSMAVSGVKHLYIPQVDPNILSAYMQILPHYPKFDTVIFAADDDANAESLRKMISTGVNEATGALSGQGQSIVQRQIQPFRHLTIPPPPQSFPQHSNLKTQRRLEFEMMDDFLQQRLGMPAKDAYHHHNMVFTGLKLTLEVLKKDYPLSHQLPKYNTEVTVENKDCVAVASDLSRQGFYPLLVNFANANHPCGGVKYGAGAQEEEICRKTTLSYYLMHSEYTLREPYKMRWYQFRYTPHVMELAIRDDNKNLHWVDWRNAAPPFGVISSAAFNVKGHGKPTNYETKTREKIEAHFETAMRLGHDSIVTGAFGLGSFGGDRQFTIKTMKDMIHNKYHGVFKRVVFAIVGGPQGLYPQFKDAFETPTFPSRWSRRA